MVAIINEVDLSSDSLPNKAKEPKGTIDIREVGYSSIYPLPLGSSSQLSPSTGT